MAPHSSTLAWKIPWMEEPGRLQSMGLLRVGHNWATSLSLFTFMHWRRKWPTHSSALAWRIPETGEPGGLPSVGSHRVGHDWSDLVAAAAAAFPRALSMSEALCADPAWHAFAVCSLSLPFSLKLFQKHVVPFASPTGRCYYFFYYLDVAVFMNWDKHLVGRSFISWSFQFEFHYFFCLPGEGKNIFSKHSVPFSSFPDRCIIR